MNFDLQFMLPQLHQLFELKAIVKDREFKKLSCYKNGKLRFVIHCTERLIKLATPPARSARPWSSARGACQRSVAGTLAG
jgi:hypothetical protein